MEREEKYKVFIIESLDEKNGDKLDGQALSLILNICQLENQYLNVKNKQEFIEGINNFEKSKYDFLHLSCHGDNDVTGIILSDGDLLNFAELHSIIGDKLTYKRLFMSVCKVAVFEFAKYFIPQNHCFSIIGHPGYIPFDKSAVFWSSFYYLMYNNDKQLMNQGDLKPTLILLTKLFGVDIKYFSIISDKYHFSIDHLNEITITNGIISEIVFQTPYLNKFRYKDDYPEDDYPEQYLNSNEPES